MNVRNHQIIDESSFTTTSYNFVQSKKQAKKEDHVKFPRLRVDLKKGRSPLFIINTESQYLSLDTSFDCAFMQPKNLQYGSKNNH